MTEWQDDRMTWWPDDRMTDDWVTGWLDDWMMTRWSDDLMTGWPNDRMTEVLDDWMSGWLIDQMTRWLDDEKLRRRLMVWYIFYHYSSLIHLRGRVGREKQREIAFKESHKCIHHCTALLHSHIPCCAWWECRECWQSCSLLCKYVNINHNLHPIWLMAEYWENVSRMSPGYI